MNKLTKNGTQKILDVYNAVFKGMRALHGTSETMQAASGTCTLLKGHVQYQPPRTGEGTKLGSDKLAIMSRCRVASISLISRGNDRQGPSELQPNFRIHSAMFLIWMCVHRTTVAPIGVS